MKRAVGLLALVALCALPAAHGESIQLTTNVLHAMTPIGATPTKSEIEAIFPPNQAVQELTKIARGVEGNTDTGVRLRAIRALPEFCLPSCAGTVPHATLTGLLDSLVTNPQEGTSILLLRATIEAVGIAKGGVDDVGRLTRHLTSSSRDIRTAVAFALRDLCQRSAMPHLRAQYNLETVMQVRLAISAALRDLDTCTN